jgi:predicted enzyme related to lactoylglutathione lyase
MLSNCRFDAVLPATDIDRAKRFYGETLALSSVGATPDGGQIYECAEGTRLAVYPSEAPPNGHYTQGSWEVDDIEDEVASLRARGIVFEEYDLPGLRTEDGIATVGGAKGGWFKDSEGNLLGVVQLA